MKEITKISEKDLTESCAKGDVKAQRALYTKYATKVNALFARYLGDEEEAKDMTHDLILKVYDSITKYHYLGEGSLWGWIKRMAINMAINKVTRGVKFESIEENEKVLEIVDTSYEDVERIPASELLKMIAGLPDTQRLIMNMFCFDNYSHKEIASRIGITEKASASLLSKARKALKRKMNDYMKV